MNAPSLLHWCAISAALIYSSVVVQGCSGKSQHAKEKEEGDTPTIDKPQAAAPPGELPELVALAEASLTAGFAGEDIRDKVSLPAFRITKYPIQRREYESCVEAGACTQSEAARCDASGFEQLRGRALDAAESPQTCTSVAEASEYCAWIGGRLPTLPEWLLAARGSEPRRFAWGDKPASCNQHPRASDMPGAFLDEEAAQEAGCTAPAGAALEVKSYPDGASPAGLEAVLLTPGELVGPRQESETVGCSSELEGCFVYGLAPGAIDSVYPLGRAGEPTPAAALAPHVYGFRCVLEGE